MAGVSPVPVTVMTGATSGAVQVAASVAAVQWDHEKPKVRQREQEEQLREYVAHHLYPYSPAYRRRFDGDVPVGYSSEDLERLSEAGRRILHLAGLTRDDAIVDVTPAGPSLEFWQLVDGARSAGLSAVHLGAGVAPERIEAAAPTVLAGTPEALQAALESLRKGEHHIDGLRTLLVLGTLLDEADRAALRALGQEVGEADIEVELAWAPARVRALWAECRGGRFFHTYPDMEWL